MKPLSAVNVAKYFTDLAQASGYGILRISTLHYLLFIAQRKHIRSKLKPLFYEPIIKWFNTIEVPGINELYVNFSIELKNDDPRYEPIDEKTKLFLQKVCDKYSKLSAEKLERLVMQQPEVVRASINEEIGFDVLLGNSEKLVKSYSNSIEFNKVHSKLLPVLVEFNVDRFVVKRFWKNTLEVLLASKEFNGGSYRENVSKLLDFSFEHCPTLHNDWLVGFRPKGTKDIDKKG